MSTITSQNQFKSGYKAKVTLMPVTVINQAIPTEERNLPIQLTVSGNKSLPGFEDGEEWDFKTDNPDQEVGEKIVGKFGGITPLAFEVPYDPVLMKKLVAHAETKFTVQIVYDDAQLDYIYGINVLGCFLKNPANTGGTGNADAPKMTITLQPRGGCKLSECLEMFRTNRNTLAREDL